MYRTVPTPSKTGRITLITDVTRRVGMGGFYSSLIHEEYVTRIGNKTMFFVVLRIGPPSPSPS
jgi:hypothetical protein